MGIRLIGAIVITSSRWNKSYNSVWGLIWNLSKHLSRVYRALVHALKIYSQEVFLRSKVRKKSVFKLCWYISVNNNNNVAKILFVLNTIKSILHPYINTARWPCFLERIEICISYYSDFECIKWKLFNFWMIKHHFYMLMGPNFMFQDPPLKCVTLLSS